MLIVYILQSRSLSDKDTFKNTKSNIQKDKYIVKGQLAVNCIILPKKSHSKLLNNPLKRPQLQMKLAEPLQSITLGWIQPCGKVFKHFLRAWYCMESVDIVIWISGLPAARRMRTARLGEIYSTDQIRSNIGASSTATVLRLRKEFDNNNFQLMLYFILSVCYQI